LIKHFKKTMQHFTVKPLQAITTPLRHWSEQRQLAREIQEAQHKIAEATNEQLANFHEILWSHWPDAVEHVRQQIRKEEVHHEQQ
jgi:hypothetical protein